MIYNLGTFSIPQMYNCTFNWYFCTRWTIENGAYKDTNRKCLCNRM